MLAVCCCMVCNDMFKNKIVVANENRVSCAAEFLLGFNDFEALFAYQEAIGGGERINKICNTKTDYKIVASVKTRHIPLSQHYYRVVKEAYQHISLVLPTSIIYKYREEAPGNKCPTSFHNLKKCVCIY